MHGKTFLAQGLHRAHMIMVEFVGMLRCNARTLHLDAPHTYYILASYEWYNSSSALHHTTLTLHSHYTHTTLLDQH